MQRVRLIKVKITSPGDVAELMMSKMKDLEQEHFVGYLIRKYCY